MLFHCAYSACCFTYEGLTLLRFHLIPSRLSHDRTIDLTVRLFVAAETFCRRPTPSHQEVCRQHYARALQSLRRSLACGKDLNANEEVLIAIAMLATASHMLKSPDTAAHLKGTNAVLAAQPDDGKQASELMRASMLRNTVMMFASPLCKGEASPCDMNRCWLEMEVPALYATTKVGKENARLRMLSQQLFMRLPRLIAAVRKLRAGDAAGLTQATDLARDLLTLQDKAAESSVLHAVSVRKSSPQDSAVLPYRYHFPDHHLYEAAVYYWQARLILNSLRVKIKVLHPNNRYTCADGIIEELEAENVNFAMNMLMTLPYAIDIGWYGRHPLFIGTMALWGVTCTGASHLRSTPMDQIRALILRRYRELMHRGAELTESLMDEAADTLAGGPIGALLYGYFG